MTTIIQMKHSVTGKWIVNVTETEKCQMMYVIQYKCDHVIVWNDMLEYAVGEMWKAVCVDYEKWEMEKWEMKHGEMKSWNMEIRR